MRHSAPALLAALLAVCAMQACSRASAPRSSQPPASGQARLIAAERNGGTTTFWSINPQEPAERRLLARVQHDASWGVRAAVSPDGRAIAYTWLAPGTSDPDREATLTILDLTSRTARRLATQLDLRTTPVWTADGSGVLVQRPAPGGGGALALITLDGGQWIAAMAAPGHRLQPVAASAEEVSYVDSGADGAWLRRASPDGNSQAVVKLAGGAARAFSPSPDGRALAYLRLQARESGARYEAAIADIASGSVRALFAETARIEDTGVAWPAVGIAAVSAVDGDGSSGVLLSQGQFPAARVSPGFDALVSASPDGRWLVMRAFDGGDPRRPGTETLQLLGIDGRRQTVPGSLTWLGWTAR